MEEQMKEAAAGLRLLIPELLPLTIKVNAMYGTDPSNKTIRKFTEQIFKLQFDVSNTLDVIETLIKEGGE